LALEKDHDRFNQKAKYEFMQEFSIIPNKREENHRLDTETNNEKNKK